MQTIPLPLNRQTGVKALPLETSFAGGNFGVVYHEDSAAKSEKFELLIKGLYDYIKQADVLKR